MGELEILEITRVGIVTMLKVAAPIMAAALVVGVAVSLLQALTQIQEMTLSFVPKLLAVLATGVISLPFMMATLVGFTNEIFARIAHGG